MDQRVAVIGSNSFSGSHFVNYVLAEGADVLGVSRSRQPHPVFLAYAGSGSLHGRFAFEQADLNHDLDSLVAALTAFRPQYVVNFAAQSMVGQSWDSPRDWFMTNTVSPLMLYDRLRAFDCLERFVQVSTPEVYGNCSGTVTEDAPYNPSTPYAVSKAAADMNLMAFRNAYGFPVVFTRAANVYGPCQQLYRIVPTTVLSILTGKKLQLHGGGHSVRSFIHIRDVVNGTLKAAQQGTPGDIFHFSTDRMISIRELVLMICEMMGVAFADHVEVVGDRLGKDEAYRLDTRKARVELGWSDRVGLEEGLAETIAWVRDNLNVLRDLPRYYVHKE